jgi:hypothetical protein
LEKNNNDEAKSSYFAGYCFLLQNLKCTSVQRGELDRQFFINLKNVDYFPFNSGQKASVKGWGIVNSNALFISLPCRTYSPSPL